MQDRLDQLRQENEQLKRQIAEFTDLSATPLPDAVNINSNEQQMWERGSHGLDSPQVTRYSRQILLRSFGAEGRHKASCLALLVLVHRLKRVYPMQHRHGY